jgi:hypothetical protein
LKKRPLQPGHKPSAALTTKVQDGHDDDFINIEPCLSLPDSLQRELAPLGREPTEVLNQSLLKRDESPLGNG